MELHLSGREENLSAKGGRQVRRFSPVAKFVVKMVRDTGFEPVTPTVSR